MSPTTRTEFLRSRLYRCALSFNKRNEQRLKNIRDLLEKADEKSKRTKRSGSKKKYTSTWKIPDCDDRVKKGRNSAEDRAILSANQDESKWVYDESNDEYSLTLGGKKVMTIPVVSCDATYCDELLFTWFIYSCVLYLTFIVYSTGHVHASQGLSTNCSHLGSLRWTDWRHFG